MKRITYVLVLLSLIFGAQCIYAQPEPVDYGKLIKKISKSDAEIADAKKAQKIKTWLRRGELFMDVTTSYQMSSYAGVTLDAFLALAGKPDSIDQVEFDGNPFIVCHMPRVDFYFNAQRIFSHYKILDPIVDDPLLKAQQAFEKALQLDEKGKKREHIQKHMHMIHDMMANEGVNYYIGKDMSNAILQMEHAVALGKLPVLDLKDTLVMYYAGVVNLGEKHYPEAASYFLQAINNGYTLDGQTYCTYFEAAKLAGQMEEAKIVLEEAVDKYPEQLCIIQSLINYYLLQDKDPDQVLPYIEKAIARDPKNPVLYFVQGVIYDRLQSPDKALQAYDKAIALDKTFADAHYNKAILFYNKAVVIEKEALDLPRARQNEYDDLMKKAINAYKESIPYGEEVLKIDSKHEAARKLLKTLYFRFRNDPVYKAKYDALVGEN